MSTEITQLHLAAKLEKTPGKFVNTHLSGRAVRVRQLDPVRIQKIEADTAKSVGETATVGELLAAQRMACVYEMVTEYSDPTDDPVKPGLKWHKANSVAFVTPGDPGYWGSLFTAKDTGFLRQVYVNTHVMGLDEFEMLAGKGTPVLSGD